MSIVTSLFTLSVNFYNIWSEARYHGISITKYILSVLQLSEIPLPIFVPRIGKIEKGELETVNWINHPFSNESYIPIAQALSLVLVLL